MRHSLRTAIALCTFLPMQAAHPADVERGKTLYESRCVACHSLDANRVGPQHRGVFGSRSGTVGDYDYSPALKKAELTWNERTLDAWLADPEKAVPGQKMGYRVEEGRDRADLIAYLRRESGK